MCLFRPSLVCIGVVIMEMPKLKTMCDHQQQDSGTKLHKNNKEVFPTENKMMMSTKKLPMDDKLSKKNALQLHHERMGHISHDRLRLMAKKGITPRKFSDQHDPKCEVCVMTKTARRQWRHKRKKNEAQKVKLDLGKQCQQINSHQRCQVV